MRAPAKNADNMAGVPLHGMKRCIEGRATNGIVNDVEASSPRELYDIVFDRHGNVVDGSRAKSLDDLRFLRRNGGEDLCAKGASNLDGNMTDTARASVDENPLPFPHVCRSTSPSMP